MGGKRSCEGWHDRARSRRLTIATPFSLVTRKLKRRRKWRHVPPRMEIAICTAYARTGSSEKIARRFGTNRQTVHNILRRNGVPLFPRPQGPRPFPERVEHAIATAYTDGTAMWSLVRTYRTSAHRIVAVLARRGVPLRTAEDGRRNAALRRRRFTPDPERAICDMYITQQRSLSETAAAWTVSTETVRDILHRHGFAPRTGSEGMRALYARHRRPFTATEERTLCRRYVEAQLSVVAIAERGNVSRRAVIGVLTKHGVSMRSRAEAARTRWARLVRKRS